MRCSKWLKKLKDALIESLQREGIVVLEEIENLIAETQPTSPDKEELEPPNQSPREVQRSAEEVIKPLRGGASLNSCGTGL